MALGAVFFQVLMEQLVAAGTELLQKTAAVRFAIIELQESVNEFERSFNALLPKVRHVQHNPQLALDLALTLAQVRRWMLEESVKVPPKMMARIDEVLDFDALLRRPKRAGDN